MEKVGPCGCLHRQPIAGKRFFPMFVLTAELFLNNKQIDCAARQTKR